MAVPTALASLSWPVKPFKTRDIGMAVRLCHLTTREQECGFVMRTQRRMQRGCATWTRNSGDHPELSNFRDEPVENWMPNSRLTCDSPTAPSLLQNTRMTDFRSPFDQGSYRKLPSVLGILNLSVSGATDCTRHICSIVNH